MNKPRYELLSAAHFEVMAQLWADSEVIRYTAVERPCTPAQPRLRMEALLEGQQGLPVPTIYLVRCKGEPCGVVGAPPLGKGWRRFGFFYQILLSISARLLGAGDRRRGGRMAGRADAGELSPGRTGRRCGGAQCRKPADSGEGGLSAMRGAAGEL